MSSSPGSGPATLPTERQDLYLSLQSVDVFVRDVEQSLEFYVNQLGFRIVSDVILQSGRRRVGVAPPDGNAVLNLMTPEPESEEFKLIGRPTHTPRLRRIKYQQQAQARLLETQSLFGDQQPVWGGVFTRFEDPDRNSFALVSLDEISRAIEAQRRARVERLEAERRAAHELEIAKQVQARLFPQTLPVLRTLEYAGICIQARQVGGDYYDFLSLGYERLGLVLSDISGKGIAAALLMANLQANLRTQYNIASDQMPVFLRSVNELFYQNTADNVYASLFFGEYDDQSRCLRYANCGHLAALVLRRDHTLERLDSTCTVVGLFKDWDCSIAEYRLFPGDTLALYTDGITESFNDKGEEFGEQRLIEALEKHRALPVTDLLPAIVGEVRQFSPYEQHDDITLIVAKGRAS